jgi:antitoxin (DNA-binding transcriptional repressor) of toxin-antitoxin stability system
MKRTRVGSIEVGVTELRRDLKKWLDLVEQGEELIVTERGRRVARVVRPDIGERYAQLVADGVLIPPGVRPRSRIQRPLIVPSKPVSPLISEMRD